MKTKILFIMHMPPPVHGAAMVGKWIHDSKIINDEFDCFYINPSVSKAVSEVGKISPKKFFIFFKLLYRIIKNIKKIKPQICYYTPTSDGFGIYRDAITIFFIKFFCKKIILHFHNKGVKEYSNRKFADIIYRYIFKKNKVILIAEQLYPDVSKYISKNDVFFLPNGIPVTINEKQYENILRNKNYNSSSMKILYLSNMMTEKGIWILLEACKRIKDQGKKFECHFVGNWGDTNEIEFNKEISIKGLSDCVFVHGPKYGKEKEYFFINADIFVFPTFYHGETFGLVLLEAMEFGIPCISTYEGGIPSIIENMENGILVKQKDSESLKNAILLLMNNSNLRKKIGMNGRKTFEQRFSLKKFEYSLIDILKKI